MAEDPRSSSSPALLVSPGLETSTWPRGNHWTAAIASFPRVSNWSSASCVMDDVAGQFDCQVGRRSASREAPSDVLWRLSGLALLPNETRALVTTRQQARTAAKKVTTMEYLIPDDSSVRPARYLIVIATVPNQRIQDLRCGLEAESALGVTWGDLPAERVGGRPPCQSPDCWNLRRMWSRSSSAELSYRRRCLAVMARAL